MKLVSLLDEDLLKLPIKAMDEGGHYPSYIFLFIKSYVELLERYGVSKEIIEVVTEFNQNMYDVLEYYYGGDHYFSYKSFREIILLLNKDLKNLVVELEDEEFFRARVNNTNDEDPCLNDMFHIPFQLRTKVSTRRYSFPGLPCLYLGSSSYVCWAELDCPTMDTFNVARLEKSSCHTIRVLDISKTPNYIKNEYYKSENEKVITDYLKLWPLIAMCSVCVRDIEVAFKPEYIIPQMLLQWSIIEIDILRENYFIDGIKYLSVKEINSLAPYSHLGLDCPHLYNNYVFPTRKNARLGLCSYLKDRFVLKNMLLGKSTSLEKLSCNINEKTTLYSETPFYKLEQLLRNNEK